jgi:hypothetical protein
MKKLPPFMQQYDQLPDSLPIFPLPNSVVLPGGQLPLNIFEPRYLNMVNDAMEKYRLIGLIQPRDESSKPELFDVGCAARITKYEETIDGRLEIVLSGLCRFKIKDELSTTRGYRLVLPDWTEFESDYDEDEEPSEESVSLFKSVLKNYFVQNNMEADWGLLDQLGADQMANSFINYLPISDEDKQILVEADTLKNRLRAFTAILANTKDESNIRH